MQLMHNVVCAVPGGAGAAQMVSSIGGGPRPPKTLDLEHLNVLSRIAAERQRLSDLTSRAAALRHDAEELESRGRQTLSDEEFSVLMRNWDEIDSLSRTIDQLKSNTDEIEYYMRTGSILFKYYDILEKGGSAPPPTTDMATTPGPSSKSILKYFAAKPPPSTPSTPSKLIHHHPPQQHPSSVSSNSNAALLALNSELSLGGSSGRMDDRATLLEKYLYSIETESYSTRLVSASEATSPLMTTTDEASGGGDNSSSGGGAGAGFASDVCAHCKKKDRTVLLQDGYAFCNSCFTVEYILVDHDKPSYKDPPKEIAYFAYKRINHFNEWLNQVQGKETTDIPDEVYDNILLEIKKQKLTNMAELTRKKVKEILKKLRINKYYEHVPHIINRLNGMPSPHFPPELEDRLRHMFCQIQVPFLKFSPIQRKNFLSYSFCLHKMMQLLEKDQYLESFPLLKSREKLAQQDLIWKKICEELGWDFIPSL